MCDRELQAAGWEPIQPPDQSARYLRGRKGRQVRVSIDRDSDQNGIEIVVNWLVMPINGSPVKIGTRVVQIGEQPDQAALAAVSRAFLVILEVYQDVLKQTGVAAPGAGIVGGVL